MKKTYVILLVSSLFMIGCGEKKDPEAEAKKAAELEQQIQTIDQEINEGFDSLEKEAKEVENALNELDNL